MNLCPFFVVLNGTVTRYPKFEMVPLQSNSVKWLLSSHLCTCYIINLLYTAYISQSFQFYPCPLKTSSIIFLQLLLFARFQRDRGPYGKSKSPPLAFRLVWIYRYVLSLCKYIQSLFRNFVFVFVYVVYYFFRNIAILKIRMFLLFFGSSWIKRHCSRGGSLQSAFKLVCFFPL